jgi:nucleoside-diphosphate-sugar epimerase
MTSFWQGRRVLLTTRAGFKGAWMSLWLRTLGADVTGFALPPATEPNLRSMVGRGIRCVIGEIAAGVLEAWPRVTVSKIEPIRKSPSRQQAAVIHRMQVQRPRGNIRLVFP